MRLYLYIGGLASLCLVLFAPTIYFELDAWLLRKRRDRKGSAE